ncbi:MAG: SpoIIE family protein phosphatase [Terriglobales bacterium]
MAASGRRRLLLILTCVLAAALLTEAGWNLPAAALGFVATTHHGSLVVTRVTTGSPAARAGLTAGNQLTAINGHRLPRPHAMSWLQLSAVGGKPLTVRVAGASGARQIVFRPTVDSSQRMPVVLVVIFLLYFFSGLYILAYRWEAPRAFWFGWAMVAIGLLATPDAMLRWFAVWRLHGWPGGWHAGLLALELALVGASALWFSFAAYAVYRSLRLNGPEGPSEPETPVGRIFLALAAVSGFCAIAAYWSNALASHSGPWGPAANIAISATWAMLLLAGRWFTRRRWVAPNRTQLRQFQLMKWGVWVSFAPALIASAAIELAPRAAWAHTASWLIISLGFFPLIIAYAISREQLFGFQGLLRKSLQYAFFSGGLGVIFILPMIALSVAAVGELAARRPAWGLVGLAAVVLLSRTTRKPLHNVLDRRFFREAYQAEQVLGQLGARLGQFFQPEELEAYFLDRLANALHPAWAAIYATAPEEGALRRQQYFVSPHAGPAYDPPEGLARPAAADWDAPRVVASAMDSSDHGAWAGAEVVAPLRYLDQARAWLLLGPKLSEEPYAKRDLDLVAAAAGQVANGLANVTLLAEVRRRDRIGQELQMARSVQKRLLPQQLPQPAMLEIAVEYAPAREVGGDYYDVFELAPGIVALALADVAGKGFAAALLMANIQALVRAAIRLARDGQSPEQALAAQVASINRELHRSVDTAQFATLFAAVVDTHSGTLTYCNAGHELPLCVPAGMTGGALLDRGGIVLGLFPEAVYEAASTPFPPGSWLLIFTDGATDAMNPAEESYSRERLEAAVRQAMAAQGRDLAETIGAIGAQIQAFAGTQPQFDDVTLLAVRAKSAAEASAAAL